MNRRFSSLLAAAFLLMAAPAPAQAQAQQPWAPPTGSTPISYGQSLTVRSAALGRDVTVTVHEPLRGWGPGAIVYALVDPPEGDRLAAELRQRELESSMYGVVVVTIDRPGTGRQAWEASAIADFSLQDYVRYDNAVIASRTDAFERFLYDELVPLVDAEWPVTGERILAGEDWGGGFVMRMAAKRPDGFDRHVAYGPNFQSGDLEPILAAAVAHPRHVGRVDVFYHRGYGLDAEQMERLLGWLVENGSYTDVGAMDMNASEDDFIANVVSGASMVPPY